MPQNYLHTPYETENTALLPKILLSQSDIFPQNIKIIIILA